MFVKQERKELYDEVVSLRRRFHQHPELGLQEYETSRFILQYLKDIGVEDVHFIHDTGVVGLIRGANEGRTLLLRADIDALPVLEQTGLPFASEVEGVMHACGHDGHAAMLLAAAKVLVKRRASLKGNIKLFFQPNEEGAAAKECIDKGLLEEPAVDAAAGIHLWSEIETGKIGISTGAIIAGVEPFKIMIHGRGGHTGMPHKAVDPLLTAAQIVTAAQQVQTRLMDQREPTILMFGHIQSGTTYNVIPDEAILEGTVRFMYEDEQEGLARFKEFFERVIRGVCLASGAEYEISYYKDRSSPLVNDSMMTELAKQCAADLIGQENVIEYTTMVAEDFAELAATVPSVFYFVGASPYNEEDRYMHHHAKFDINEDALLTGVEMHVALAEAYLR